MLSQRALSDVYKRQYGFRGADARLMFQFQKDYREARQLLLDWNYRSTSNIVKNALKVIQNNEIRFDKKIRAKKAAGSTLHVQEVRDVQEEGQYIIEEIKKRLSEHVPAEQIAVLYRVHTDARPVVEEFVKEKIPFSMREHLPNLYGSPDGNACMPLAIGLTDFSSLELAII